ncbi:hypothetical protein A2Y85_06170 [candidate division WOR-3 bacterium RBG_13_43_14]|uniref:PEGA domain-containing protein n=1 Tax=candidate division WOR-3 bacterium RBG_13_43_14 TaxID=1802590 RepID=A0A1F4UD47_UNCW3|nr:MAG: hypothetical protein A2Y85_06170 [candidate division WOR-3 bacterium RBG_13_43_14]
MKHLLTAGKILACLAVIALFIHGCATIFKGSNEQVYVNSDPAGAKIYVNGALMGSTPVMLELKSSKTYNVEFRMDGYESKTYTLTNHLGAGWVILDVLCGLVPVVIDAVTGAWYGLDQDNIYLQLEAK